VRKEEEISIFFLKKNIRGYWKSEIARKRKKLNIKMKTLSSSSLRNKNTHTIKNHCSFIHE